MATTKGCLNFYRGTLILNISWSRSTVNLAGRRAEPQCHSHGLLNFFPILREYERNQGEGTLTSSQLTQIPLQHSDWQPATETSE